MVCTDRLFWSVLDTWKSVMTLPTDVKELIPEFYSDPSFLINNEKLNFGDRAAGASHLIREIQHVIPCMPCNPSQCAMIFGSTASGSSPVSTSRTFVSAQSSKPGKAKYIRQERTMKCFSLSACLKADLK